MRSKRQGLVAVLVGALGIGLAGCGSGSKAAGVITVPSGGATAQAASASTTTPTSTTATTTVKTPTSGPLAKAPVMPKTSGKPPAKLVIKDLVKGTGAAAKSGSSVVVNYTGELYSNDKVFDSSWKRSQTFGPFTLGQGAVIPGWDQGLVGMRVGGRRELIIPSKLAYGKSGSGSTIPPNSALVFVVDLLSSKG
ncbi:MAG TPA: FKBP-type peptidyl-prolyl cis-trans isomerase [Solirubrobacteraceae bacterium]|jgi:peptidylprolyl isomerase|nr:FKBP-type peptidyl-prolyl cis-trans isomerase [Solirubrobacteraceae bacterium]